MEKVGVSLSKSRDIFMHLSTDDLQQGQTTDAVREQEGQVRLMGRETCGGGKEQLMTQNILYMCKTWWRQYNDTDLDGCQWNGLTAVC